VERGARLPGGHLGARLPATLRAQATQPVTQRSGASQTLEKLARWIKRTDCDVFLKRAPSPLEHRRLETTLRCAWKGRPRP
jgi:hypothetical protein